MSQLDKLTIAPIDSSNGAFFASLAMPDYKRVIYDPALSNSFLILGARLGGWPVGLAIAEKLEGAEAEQALLASIMVLPTYRNQGIATALLQSLETGLAAQGCCQLNIIFPDRPATAPALEQILEKQGWSSPQPTFKVYRGNIPTLENFPFSVETRTLPADFELFKWAELSQDELAGIDNLLQTDTRYQGRFIEKPAVEYEPRTSLGLRRQGEVVGWCFAKLVGGGRMLSYDGFFVRRDARRPGHTSLGLSLAANAIYRHAQIRDEIPQFSFTVELANRHIVRFDDTYFAPFSNISYFLKRAGKPLPVQANARPV